MQAEEPNIRGARMKPLPTAVKTTLIVLWAFGLLFTLASIVTAIVVASYASGADRAFGFVAVWLAILLIVVSAFGTYVLRRAQSAFAVGLLLGMVAMLSQTGIILFALFVGLAKKEHGHLEEAENAMAAWSFLIFIVYGIFAGVAFAFRDCIIDPAQSGVTPNSMQKTPSAAAVSLPPPRATEESKIQDVTAGYNV